MALFRRSKNTKKPLLAQILGLILNNISTESEPFYKILSLIKFNFLKAIINIGNDENLPEINKLKLLFKDENGI